MLVESARGGLSREHGAHPAAVPACDSASPKKNSHEMKLRAWDARHLAKQKSGIEEVSTVRSGSNERKSRVLRTGR
jgi:hypothetical protein